MHEFRTSDYPSLAHANIAAHGAGGEVVLDTPQTLTDKVWIERPGLSWRGSCGVGAVDVEGGQVATIYAHEQNKTLVEIKANDVHLREIAIRMRNPGDNSVALQLGVGGYYNGFNMSGCVIETSPTSSKAGYGFNMDGGLKGVVNSSIFRGWKYGMRLRSVYGSDPLQRPNAWTFLGCTFIWNETGLTVEDARGCYVAGGTIEGNDTGVKVINGAQATLANVHLENAGTNLVVLDGCQIISRGCRNTVADVGVWVRQGEKGGGRFSSYHDTISCEMRNDTGDPDRMVFHDPIFAKHGSVRGAHRIVGTPVYEPEDDGL